MLRVPTVRSRCSMAGLSTKTSLLSFAFRGHPSDTRTTKTLLSRPFNRAWCGRSMNSLTPPLEHWRTATGREEKKMKHFGDYCIIEHNAARGDDFRENQVLSRLL